MTASKHTAGPWVYNQWGRQILTRAKGSDQILIATVAINTRDDEGYYSAHLIAAAPQMYDALEQLADSLEESIKAEYPEPIHPAVQHKYDRDMSEVIEARNLLAKARGES